MVRFHPPVSIQSQWCLLSQAPLLVSFLLCRACFVCAPTDHDFDIVEGPMLLNASLFKVRCSFILCCCSASLFLFMQTTQWKDPKFDPSSAGSEFRPKAFGHQIAVCSPEVAKVRTVQCSCPMTNRRCCVDSGPLGETYPAAQGLRLPHSDVDSVDLFCAEAVLRQCIAANEIGSTISTCKGWRN